MIFAQTDKSQGLIARLSARASAIAKAHTAARLLRRRGDPSRWRRADLIWPTFGEDN